VQLSAPAAARVEIDRLEHASVMLQANEHGSGFAPEVAIADLPADHISRFVAGLRHDDHLAGTGRGGAGGKEMSTNVSHRCLLLIRAVFIR
jgi:hypothetical protein